MELSSAIIGVACVALFTVPVFLLSKTGNQKHKQRIRALLAFGANKGLNLSKTDVWNDSAIGIDDNLSQLAYLKDAEEDTREVLIDLNDVTQCNIINTSREVKNGGNSQRVIERLDLKLSFKKSDTPPVLLEFYNARKQYQLSEEFQLIEKWEKIIKQTL